MPLHAIWPAPIAPSSINHSTAVPRAAGLYRGVRANTEQTFLVRSPVLIRGCRRGEGCKWGSTAWPTTTVVGLSGQFELAGTGTSSVRTVAVGTRLVGVTDRVPMKCPGTTPARTCRSASEPKYFERYGMPGPADFGRAGPDSAEPVAERGGGCWCVSCGGGLAALGRHDDKNAEPSQQGLHRLRPGRPAAAVSRRPSSPSAASGIGVEIHQSIMYVYLILP
jgi:hypothetical protein